jgi:LysR family transcriptional activator of nhaA
MYDVCGGKMNTQNLNNDLVNPNNQATNYLIGQQWLNYHHLYYFWVVAKEGTMTRAAEKLRLSQSTLSEQIKLLEESLGTLLFDRVKRTLVLTEAGRLSFEYCEKIFSTGAELYQLLQSKTAQVDNQLIRIGSLNSISKNLQIRFLEPFLANEKIQFVVVEGSLTYLTEKLRNHQLDIILSNFPARTDVDRDLFNHTIGEMNVVAMGTGKFINGTSDIKEMLKKYPIFIPTFDSEIRSGLDRWFKSNEVEPNIKGEIEDMALMRLMAMSGQGIVLAPEIIAIDELRNGTLKVFHRFEEMKEYYYAITPDRKFKNTIVDEMSKITIK